MPVAVAEAKLFRKYHFELSKVMIKLKRYIARGRIQRNGITATSWVNWSVTASNSVEAKAARPVHFKGCLMLGVGSAIVLNAAGSTFTIDPCRVHCHPSAPTDNAKNR